MLARFDTKDHLYLGVTAHELILTAHMAQTTDI